MSEVDPWPNTHYYTKTTHHEHRRAADGKRCTASLVASMSADEFGVVNSERNEMRPSISTRVCLRS